LVLAEAAIDALSLAAIQCLREDTLYYAASGGGMGSSSISALEALLASIAALTGAMFCSAADANEPGDRFADRHRSLAEKLGVPFARHLDHEYQTSTTPLARSAQPRVSSKSRP
jgi:hypothetical protein